MFNRNVCHSLRRVTLSVVVLFALSSCAHRYELPVVNAGSSAVAENGKIPEPVAVSTELEVTDRVAIKTNHGTIVIGLYGKAAPISVKNFLGYVDGGFYPGKIFHRVIPGFMIQGGGFNAELVRDISTQDPIRLELIPGLKHMPGTVSMARTNDPYSATSQFFICVAPTPQLNGLYAAFGKVEEGMDIAIEISGVKTGSAESADGVLDDVPVTPVVIESVTRL